MVRGARVVWMYQAPDDAGKDDDEIMLATVADGTFFPFKTKNNKTAVIYLE
jgi:hypothetical protein